MIIHKFVSISENSKTVLIGFCTSLFSFDLVDTWKTIEILTFAAQTEDQMRLLKSEKQVFRLHFLYALLEGVVMGVLALNEFVFLKSLKGSNIQVSMVFQFSMVVFIFLIFVNVLLQRTENKKKLIRRAGLLARLPLLLLLFFPASIQELTTGNIWFYHLSFLAILFIYYLGTLAIYPTINLLLKQNYTHQNFGRLFGIAHSAQKIMWVFATFGFGLVFHYLNNRALKIDYAYRDVGLLGKLHAYTLSLTF